MSEPTRDHDARGTPTGEAANQRQHPSSVESDDDREPILCVGALTLYPHRYLVRVAGETVALSPMEMKILTVLAERSEQAVSRDAILRACHDHYVGVTSASVSRRVQRLRQKLGEAGGRIDSVHGIGYRLTTVQRRP